jgi:hypothetical protein
MLELPHHAHGALPTHVQIALPLTVVENLNAVLRGWGAYFRFGNSSRKFTEIDSYVHERLAILANVKHGTTGRRWTTCFTYRWGTASSGCTDYLERCATGLRMPCGERCRRAVCGRTACTV